MLPMDMFWLGVGVGFVASIAISTLGVIVVCRLWGRGHRLPR